MAEITQNLIEWLANGERGISSETIFSHLTGIDALRGWRPDHPYDTSDFRRCRLLLERAPELAAEFPRMREVSPQWHALVDNWGAISLMMDAESPNWRKSEGRAPKANELIRRVIGRSHG